MLAASRVQQFGERGVTTRAGLEERDAWRRAFSRAAGPARGRIAPLAAPA